MEFEDFDDVEDEIDEEQQDQREQVPPSPRADQPHSQNRRRPPRKAPSKKSNDRDEMIAAFHSIIQKQERERLREKAEAMYERTFKRRDRRRDESYYRRRSSSPHRSSDADDYMSDYMTVFFTHAKKQIPTLTRKHIDQWEKQDLIVAKRARKKKPTVRRSVITYNPNQIWEGDLVDMFRTNIRLNGNVRYLLLLVDQMSKKMFCQPVLKGKKDAPQVLLAFKKIFQNTTARPRYIYSDKGSEFIAGSVKSYLKNRQGIDTWNSKDKDIKAAIVERAIRTLKSRIFTMIDAGTPKYITHLQDIVNGINQTAGRITKVAPDNVDPITAPTVSENLSSNRSRQESKFRRRQPVKQFKLTTTNKPPTPLFHLGDYVLMKKEKKTFTKEHSGMWNDEIFQISKAKTDSKPYVYHVKDLKGSPITGYFNEAELKEVHLPATFRLEKTNVFKRRIYKVNGVKYIEIKTTAYHKPINLPLDTFKRASTSPSSISSHIFIQYLRAQPPSDNEDDRDEILLERERDEGDKILRERSKNPFISSHFFEVDTKKVTDEGHRIESSTRTTMITSANGRVMENSRDFCHEDDACPVTENNLDDDDEDTLLDSEVVDLREFSLDSKNERLANALKAKGVSVITGGNAHCTYCSKWRKFNKIRWPIIAQYKLLDLILTLLLIFWISLMTWRFGTYQKNSHCLSTYADDSNENHFCQN
eukprot:Seg3589.4 transcript_id=Seg3589.4/GoldUCD/mRNA.D3Y31 product="putative transposon-derived protein F54H12.3" protein_id=Seg3589.4/GoldUCD/D3Y31